jgi:hypothetical protein
MVSTTKTSSAADRPQTVFISELPNELLVQILQSVPGDYNEQCKAFSAIALVNRHLRSVVTPLLYRDFQDCCARHLHLFGRTVLSDRTRAKLVIQYEGRRAGFLFNDSIQHCPVAWNEFILDQALARVIEERLPSLRGPITRAVFAYALACILPELQRLDVTNAGNTLFQQLAKSDPHAVVPFRQLHTLKITIEPDRVYPMCDISLLLVLPSLRVLSADMAALNDKEIQNSQHALDVWQCKPRSSTIRELSLARCGLPAGWIAKMVLSCQILRHFHYEHYYYDHNTVFYERIVHALSSHKDTLTDLRLNELDGCKLNSASQSDPSKPITFCQFTSLTHLDIPLVCFATRTHHCAIDTLLPASLTVLTADLRSAREGFSDAFFILLAEAVPTHLPRLNSVEIICRIEKYCEEGSLPLHFCHLRRMFHSRDVELMYFLEFVQCEFKAGKSTLPLLPHYPDTWASLHGANAFQHEDQSRWL